MDVWPGIALPIIQAPMAGVQGSALAAAVCDAGGLGSLPCALLTLEDVRRELASLAARTSRPYNVNFFCHTMPGIDDARESAWRRLLSPYYDELGVVPPAAAPAGRLPFNAETAQLLQTIRPAFVISRNFPTTAAVISAIIKSIPVG
jgi:nitronate monooxygenase